jgi:hypothetical protein
MSKQQTKRAMSVFRLVAIVVVAAAAFSGIGKGTAAAADGGWTESKAEARVEQAAHLPSYYLDAVTGNPILTRALRAVCIGAPARGGVTQFITFICKVHTLTSPSSEHPSWRKIVVHVTGQSTFHWAKVANKPKTPPSPQQSPTTTISPDTMIAEEAGLWTELDAEYWVNSNVYFARSIKCSGIGNGKFVHGPFFFYATFICTYTINSIPQTITVAAQ